MRKSKKPKEEYHVYILQIEWYGSGDQPWTRVFKTEQLALQQAIREIIEYLNGNSEDWAVQFLNNAQDDIRNRNYERVLDAWRSLETDLYLYIDRKDVEHKNDASDLDGYEGPGEEE